jgi:hypothetical protein
MLRKWTVLCTLLLFSHATAGDNEYLKKTTLHLLDTYCPDGSRIVRQCMPLYPKARDTEFTSMIDGDDEAACINSLNTVVHEENHTGHTFVSRAVLEKRFGKWSDVFYEYDYFYHRDGAFTLMKKTPTFPSIDMVPEFPEHLRTFRFDTYINTQESLQSTQNEGIYGLLDEMNSYYQGTRASFDLLRYYEAKGKDADWQGYFQNVNATLYGCLEFRLYIFKYLMFAKKHHSGKYWTILGNKAWCHTFLETDREVSDLIRTYEKAKPAVFKRLTGYGFTVSENDSYITITRGGRTSQHMNFKDVLNLLSDEMKKPEYVEIEKTIREWAGDWDPESMYEDIEQAMKSDHAADQGEDRSGPAEPAEPVEPAESPEPGGTPEPESSSFEDSAVWSDRAGDAGHGFIDLTAASVSRQGNGLEIRMKLADFPKQLAFCQRSVPENRQEYRWAAFFDVDGDGADETSVELIHFKPPDSQPLSGDPLTVGQLVVWELSGQGGSQSDAEVRGRRDGNELVFDLPKCPWQSSIGSRTRIRFETYYTDGKTEDSDRLPD